ncbi:hypothetical protein DL762_009438 [Monosporascus cannonballus]|uniref:Sugar phosphate transporter domain-containing protein n=1 Tax=Monosporascus cannonballus TaxID=155416 RepID=A0ABY0GWJ5_9PEZI|nr:hypothetical protein DL762_009438 [Monosporascus cannonballus]RYO79078.1 hypothetical protein DL763_009419 [Monosporascus cannonballus]
MSALVNGSHDRDDALGNGADQVRHYSLDADTTEQAGLLSEGDGDADLEKGAVQPTPAAPPQNHEDTVSTKKKLIYLAGYFICNIGLTIYNKAILGSLGHYHAAKLTRQENLTLVAFSFLFTINIAISNVSLYVSPQSLRDRPQPFTPIVPLKASTADNRHRAMVSVPFHQVVRSTTPLFTTFLFRVLFNRTFSTETYLSLVPIIFGVTIATYGDFTFTDLGFILTFLGVILAAFKTIVTNRMMTGSLALSFWEILRRMSPLACLQSTLYALFTGELAAFRDFLRDELFAGTARFSPLGFLSVMVGNGALAFALNVSSFSTNKVAGALTMTVCANIKQCLTIVLGGILFDVHLNALNMWGIVITVLGGAVYSFVELDSKKRNKARAAAAATGGSRETSAPSRT